MSLIRIARISSHKTEAERVPELAKWRPSRFNARTTVSNGQILLWNSRSGRLTAFGPGLASRLNKYLSRPGFTGELDGFGDYLRKRGYLVSLLDGDEFAAFDSVASGLHYAKDRLELIVLASEDCNLRCKYCYETFPRGAMAVWVRVAIKKMLAGRRGDIRSLNVSWFGGEPLYGFEAVEDLAPFISEFCSTNSIAYSSHVTTNGFLLTPAIASRLFEWSIRDFQITLDGLASDHDRNRPTRDGKGTFATIIQNILSLRDRADHFRVALRINCDPTNIRSIPGLLDVLGHELAGDVRFSIAFHPVGKWGGPNDQFLEVFHDRDQSLVVRELEAKAIDNGLQVRSALSNVRCGSQVCYAARPYSFIVGSDGTLMKCTVALREKDYNVIGQIALDGTLMIDPHKFSLWTEPAYKKDAGCR